MKITRVYDYFVSHKKVRRVSLAALSMTASAVTKAQIKTSLGTIDLELDEVKAPITVKNFVEYAKGGFYEGTIFHRVIQGFMIQGGGFTKGMEQKETRSPIKNEAGNGLANDRYTIAMARTMIVDSATAQFFINVNDNVFLNHRSEDMQGYGYAVFGKVTKGTEVVDKIAAVKTGRVGPFSDVPEEPVVIEKVTVEEPAAEKAAAVVEDPLLFKTIQTRGSCRQFDPNRPVDDATLEKLLRAAMCAPSAMDRRPWEFIVVRDKAQLKAIAEKIPNSRVGNGAQAAIVVCGSQDNGLPGRGKEYWIHDCSAASMNILLAAHGLGLGAVWTAGFPSEERVNALRGILLIPATHMPLCVIPIGYPLAPVVAKDKWNPAKIRSDRW